MMSDPAKWPAKSLWKVEQIVSAKIHDVILPPFGTEQSRKYDTFY